MHNTIKIALVALCAISRQPTNPYPTIADIPTPAGFHRIPAPPQDFTAYLRRLPLKKDRTVYLYNGRPKQDQDAQFAVLDVSVGEQDLQQCADAVMRLRAEYLYSQGKFAGIDFYTEQGVRLNFQQWTESHHSTGRATFDSYLVKVFTYCSTRTLQKALRLKPFGQLSAGDVFIHGGAPGHAMLVVDVAEDASGNRVYLLAQSYMPAQDIHIVKNPADPAGNPWYRVDPAQSLLKTPEWVFTTNELRSWP
jgi:hypothetical protein